MLQPSMFGTSMRHSENLYHKDRLIVKMHPTLPRTAIQSMTTTVRASFLSTSPGLNMIDRLDQAGLIKRVTPLDVPIREAGQSSAPQTAMFSMLIPQMGVSSSRPRSSTGLCIVQATEGTDLMQLNMALSEDPNVEYVSRVPIRYLQARKRAITYKQAKSKKTPQNKKNAGSEGATVTAVPPNPLTMWNLQKIRWQQARNAGLNDASSIRVGVLDTGIDLGHPDLPGPQIEYNFNYGLPQSSVSDEDVVGHGTHVSGTIRALINANIGINGICDCQLIAYKIFEDEPGFSEVVNGFDVFQYFVEPEMYHSALIQCLDDEIQVINLSIGGFGEPSTTEKTLFRDLIDNGVVVVAAMGNEDSFMTSYPAGIDGVIAVGATQPSDKRASFSNKGQHISLCAPGVSIWSTLPTYPGETARYRNRDSGQIISATRETDYAAWDGTSMAAPHVTAAAALLLHQNSSLTPADVKSILTNRADKVLGMNGVDFTPQYGFGRLNLEQLANA